MIQYFMNAPVCDYAIARGDAFISKSYNYAQFLMAGAG